MRTLGIDLGARRVGLALSDAGGRLATPLRVLSVSSEEQAIVPILAIIEEEGVERIVLGLPLNMDDSIGPAARGVMEWAKIFQMRCKVPLVFVDERLSSFVAEQDLIARQRLGEKMTRKQKKGQLDAMAAAMFLQGFLDGKIEPYGA